MVIIDNETIECEYCDINFNIKDYLQHRCYTDWFCGICNVYHVKGYICNAFDYNEICSICYINHNEKQKVLDISTQTE